MRSGFATLAVVGVAACVAVYAMTAAPEGKSLYSNVLSTDDLEFLKYVAKYGKSYGTKEEFEFRGEVFKNTLAALSEENSKNDNTFRVGANKFADWTPAEFKRILSYKPIRGMKAEALDLENVSIPDAIDWRSQGKVNPVKDQGQCGSCWAFSAVGAIESRYAIKTGAPVLSLSEQQLVDCAGGTYGNEGCNGGDMGTAIQYAHDYGLELESDYPYHAVDQTCQYDKTKVHAKPTGVQNVATNNALALKTAIADGPVSVAIEADTFVFQFYSGGILNSKACGTNLDHGVVAVGYGADASGKPYYIVRNSWGSSWGLGGYINIAIVDGAGICGIQMEPVYPTF